jgi:hypothetical protein
MSEIDPSTGATSGTPNAAGKLNVRATVKDNAGATASGMFTRDHRAGGAIDHDGDGGKRQRKSRHNTADRACRSQIAIRS